LLGPPPEPLKFPVAESTIEKDFNEPETPPSSCPVNNPQINFQTRHAAPHFDDTGLSQADIEAEIENGLRYQFNNTETTVQGPFMGRISYQDTTIEYRGFGLLNGTVNIGTYYPVSF
jgi:hypothetical protein